MSTALAPVTAAGHTRHRLHTDELPWTETNCYVDLWVELLHALGVDPLDAAAFPLAADFDGEQWSFVKYPAEDLRDVYGIDVAELNVWRPVIEHAEQQRRLGRLLTVEVDSWYLPDTAGVSYRLAHAKSTIVPYDIDRAARRLGYFHNAGYFELDGDDFDGVFRLGAAAPGDGAAALPPYVELVRLEGLRREPATAAELTALTRRHLARRPADNPVARLGERLAADLPELRAADSETFHRYAFGTCRMCGASAQLAGAFVAHLAERTAAAGDDRAAEAFTASAAAWQTLAEQAKTLQFTLARLARGRSGSIDATVAAMAAQYDAATTPLVEHCAD